MVSYDTVVRRAVTLWQIRRNLCEGAQTRDSCTLQTAAERHADSRRCSENYLGTHFVYVFFFSFRPRDRPATRASVSFSLSEITRTVKSRARFRCGAIKISETSLGPPIVKRRSRRFLLRFGRPEGGAFVRGRS